VLSVLAAAALRDKEGNGLEELRTHAGFSGPLESVAAEPGRFHRFVELHIEQGPLLEQEGIDLGLVTHIAARPACGFSLKARADTRAAN